MRHLVIVVALLSAAPAAAQPSPWAPERTTAGWVFMPSVVFGGMWDSNATVRNEGNPMISETVGILNPRGEISFNGKRTRFQAGYSGVLEAYRNLDELTRYDQRGRMDAQHLLTPRLEVDTRASVALTPTTDQLELGALPFTRVGSRMVNARGGFAYELTPRAKLTAGYGFQWVEFERDPRFSRLEGGHAHRPSADLAYALSRRVTVGASWSWNHATIDGGEEILNSQQAIGTVQYVVGPGTTIRGGAGVSALRLSRNAENRSGPSYVAGITHRARGVTLDAAYERAFVPGFGFGGAVPNQMVRAGVFAPLARGRLYVNGSFAMRRSEPLPTSVEDFQLDSYWTQASLGYYVARWLRTEGFWTRTRQISTAQGDVNRTRIGIQFVTFKPVRIQ